VKGRGRNIKLADRQAYRAALNRRVFIFLYRIMLVSLVAAGMAGIVQTRRYLLTTSRLGLKVLDIEGAHRVTRWEVEVLSGLQRGQNLLSTDLDAVAEGIRRHPWVDTVTVRRVLPDRLEVRIQEREAVALLSAGDLYYVDRKGEAFKKVSSGDVLDYPVLTGLQEAGALKRRDLGRRVVREALSLMRTIEESSSHSLGVLSEIHLDLHRGFSIFTTEAGAEIHLGWNEWDRKLDRLAYLIESERLDLSRIRRIDLDLSRWAVVTPI